MKRGLSAFAVAMTAALLAVACGRETQEVEFGATPTAAATPTTAAIPTAAAPLAGTYNCLPEEVSPPPPAIVMELREDGTLTITPGAPSTGQPEPGAPDSPVGGTWSVEGSRGTLQVGGGKEQFSIEGSRLLKDDGLVCTKGS